MLDMIRQNTRTATTWIRKGGWRCWGIWPGRIGWWIGIFPAVTFTIGITFACRVNGQFFQFLFKRPTFNRRFSLLYSLKVALALLRSTWGRRRCSITRRIWRRWHFSILNWQAGFVYIHFVRKCRWRELLESAQKCQIFVENANFVGTLLRIERK